MLKFSEDKIVRKIKVEKTVVVTEEDIANIIITSFEGGSTYWMGLNNSGEEWDDCPEDEPYATWATKLLIEGKGIKLYDIEDEENEVPLLTLEGILKGIQQNHQERPWDADIENGDADTADAIMQYAVFGELVYG